MAANGDLNFCFVNIVWQIHFIYIQTISNAYETFRYNMYIWKPKNSRNALHVYEYNDETKSDC